ncbi:MAG: matrixin family metalloprotease [Deltaproteobacteria bacterium]|nr:matrixin family metalloprotease [Deltaproteobacteria bacterium]
MRRIVVSLGILASLTACGGWDAYLREPNVYEGLSPPYRISFATEIDAQQGDFDALALAVEMWNDAHDGLLVIDRDPTANFLVYIGPYEDLLEGARAGSLRFPEGQICAIYLPTETASDFPVIAHEIGHCLGFDHTQNAGSIMYEEPGDASQISPDIVEVLAQLVENGVSQ